MSLHLCLLSVNMTSSTCHLWILFRWFILCCMFIMCGLVLLVNLLHGALSRGPSWCSVPSPLSASSISLPELESGFIIPKWPMCQAVQAVSHLAFCGWRVQVLCLALMGKKARGAMPFFFFLCGWRCYCRSAKCKLNASNEIWPCFLLQLLIMKYYLSQ